MALALPHNMANPAGAAKTTLFSTAWKNTHEAVKTLGTRGPDGMPYGIRLLDISTKICRGMQWVHPVATFVTVTSDALKPATFILGQLTSPLTGFDGVVESIKTASSAMQGTITTPTLYKITVAATPSAPAQVYNFTHKVKTMNATAAQILPTMIKVVIAVADYFGSFAICIEQLSLLNAINISEEWLGRVTFIGAWSGRVLASVGLVATLINFSMAGVKLLKSEGFAFAGYQWVVRDLTKTAAERIELKAGFTQATLGLAKVALKVSLLVFAGYFTMAAQGGFALVTFSIDIYLFWHKEDAMPRKSLTLQEAVAAGVPMPELPLLDLPVAMLPLAV